MTTLGERIQQALDLAEISQAEISRRINVSPQAVNGWIKTGTIAKERLADVARETDCSLEWLIRGTGQPRQAPRDRNEALLSRPAPTLAAVPVIGYAIATPDQDGYYSDGDHPVGFGDSLIRWPSADPNAYALRVRGDSMQPRIRPGEIIVVEPNRSPEPGDDVLVKCRDGRKMVKQLLYRRTGEVVLGSINQRHNQVTVSVEEIEALHFVAGIAPRGTDVEPN